MKTYHKIQSVYKRDLKTKRFIEGDFSIPEFSFLKNSDWEFTEKIDGTNIRIYYGAVTDGIESHPDNPHILYSDKSIRFGGRTNKAVIPHHLMENLLAFFSDKAPIMYDLFQDTDVMLFGEGYGPRIQKGGKYRSDPGFILFDISVGPWWLQRKDIEENAKALELDVVPIVGEGTLLDMVDHAKQGIKSTFGDFEAEGYVARPKVELKARNGQRIITKIKCSDFKKDLK